MRVLQAVDRHRVSRRISRWVGRGVAKLRMRRITLWYHQDYGATSMALSARIPHVDLARGQKVLQFLEARGLLRASDVNLPAPVPLSVLLALHTESYLERVTQPEYLARIFGLDAASVDVDAILQAQRRAAGGTYEATRWAIRKTNRLAFNLGGGFHHARPDRGAGFCVYNDVAATIESLRASGFANPIAIVDLDYHQGDGNRASFANDASVLTYSLHGPIRADEDAALANLDVSVPIGTDSASYLARLRETLPAALDAHKPSLLFYIAGTDILARDALGDLNVSMRGALKRDQLVINWAQAHQCSTVVVMAGGYSERAWNSTAKLVEWTLTGRNEPALNEDISVRRKFGRIAQSLDPFELQRSEESWPLTEEDLMEELDGVASASRVLGYYSVHGVELAFERYGFLAKLRKSGFTDIRLEIDPSDPQRQRIRAFGQKGAGDYHLLLELLMRRRSIPVPGGMTTELPLEFLSIEWLLLQNPSEDFHPGRPRLPGQAHPGLGVLRELIEMLYQACMRLGLDGLVAHPSCFHVSAVGARHFRFLDPKVQGRFEALRAATQDIAIANVSQQLDDNALQYQDGQIIEWESVDFVAPVSERLHAYLDSDEYQQAKEAVKRAVVEAISGNDVSQK